MELLHNIPFPSLAQNGGENMEKKLLKKKIRFSSTETRLVTLYNSAETGKANVCTCDKCVCDKCSC